MSLMRATFTYFKKSGKYYTQGEGKIPSQYPSPGRDIIRSTNGGMPGLAPTSTAREFYVFVDVPESVPFLLMPEE